MAWGVRQGRHGERDSANGCGRRSAEEGSFKGARRRTGVSIGNQFCAAYSAAHVPDVAAACEEALVAEYPGGRAGGAPLSSAWRRVPCRKAIWREGRCVQSASASDSGGLGRDTVRNAPDGLRPCHRGRHQGSDGDAEGGHWDPMEGPNGHHEWTPCRSRGGKGLRKKRATTSFFSPWGL